MFFVTSQPTLALPWFDKLTTGVEVTLPRSPPSSRACRRTAAHALRWEGTLRWRAGSGLLTHHLIPDQLGVEGDDDERNQGCEGRQPFGGRERAHLGAVGGELHQRHHGERQLQAEDHLRQDQQLAGLLLAVEDGYSRRRDDGDGARHQPPQPRRQPDIEKALHDSLAGERRGDRRIEPAAQKRDAEQGRRHGRAQQWMQQCLRLAQLDDVGLAGLIEGGRRQDQNRGVDQQRKHQRDSGIEGGVSHRLALLRRGVAVGARLHDGRVQVEVVRHHRGADDAHGQVEHVRVGEDLRGRREAADQRPPFRIGERDLHGKAGGDDTQQRDDQRLQVAEAQTLQVEDEEHVERGQQHADLEGNVEQQVEPDGRADHLGDVGGDDGELRRRPQRIGGPAGVGVTAGLRQVAARGDGEPRAQRLQHDRHDVGDERDKQQRVAELGAARERGGPVARVHVSDRDEIAWPQEGREPARAGPVHLDGAVDVGQGRLAPCPAPAEGSVHSIGARALIGSFQHATLPVPDDSSI